MKLTDLPNDSAVKLSDSVYAITNKTISDLYIDIGNGEPLTPVKINQTSFFDDLSQLKVRKLVEKEKLIYKNVDNPDRIINNEQYKELFADPLEYTDPVEQAKVRYDNAITKAKWTEEYIQAVYKFEVYKVDVYEVNKEPCSHPLIENVLVKGYKNWVYKVKDFSVFKSAIKDINAVKQDGSYFKIDGRSIKSPKESDIHIFVTADDAIQYAEELKLVYTTYVENNVINKDVVDIRESLLFFIKHIRNEVADAGNFIVSYDNCSCENGIHPQERFDEIIQDTNRLLNRTENLIMADNVEVTDKLLGLLTRTIKRK